jgi:uncharacterized membrane protein YhaH (DUF805 family)
MLFSRHIKKEEVVTFIYIRVQLMDMGEASSCRLVGGVFAILVQVCLAFVCVMTLIVKRFHERPQRNWLVWCMDATKQGLGSSFGHFSNIYLSMIIAQSLTTDTESSEQYGTNSEHHLHRPLLLNLATNRKVFVSVGDECQWYCTTYVLDATVGTAFNLLLLSAFAYLIRQVPCCRERPVMVMGFYGDPPQMSLFLPQLGVWLIIVVISKLLLLATLTRLLRPIDAVLSDLFTPLRRHPELELVLVMIVIPTCLNALQFWLTDSFLKRSEGTLVDELVTSSFDETEAFTHLSSSGYHSKNETEMTSIPGPANRWVKSRSFVASGSDSSESNNDKFDRLLSQSFLPDRSDDEETLFFNNGTIPPSGLDSSLSHHKNGTLAASRVSSATPVQHVVSQVSRAVSAVVSATVAPLYQPVPHFRSRSNSDIDGGNNASSGSSIASNIQRANRRI